jgi:hypothetical protein
MLTRRNRPGGQIGLHSASMDIAVAKYQGLAR